ncbi:MAG: hypothetical protein RIT07_1529 [Bacteroidota bacterium]|jgi:hypothetical protein
MLHMPSLLKCVQIWVVFGPLPPPRTAAAAAAREADAVKRARRRPAGSPRNRCNRPQTEAALKRMAGNGAKNYHYAL